MARKLPGFTRELDARALFSVAYGEVASSIYFALGVVAAYALGFTPIVLLGVGVLFLVVSLSYAEGTAALPETGGAATFVRRASNDLAGFITGWALFLDYLIVIALSALFLPHYLAGALRVGALDRNPWDVIVAVFVIVAVGVVRLVRRPSLYGVGIVIPALDLLTQVLLVALGFALVVSPHALTQGTSIGTDPSWHAIAFSIPLAMLAFTGLETVANLAEEARSPGVDLPRSVFGGLVTVITLYVAIAVVALSAFPGPRHCARHDLGARSAAGRRRSHRHRAAFRPRRRAAVLRRHHRRADPACRRGDVDLRLLETRLLARRARSAAERIRPAEPACPCLSTRDRLGDGCRLGVRDRHVVREERRRRPRQPVLVRRAPRVHRSSARSDQAADRRARVAAAVPSAAQRDDPRCRASAPCACRCGCDVRGLDHRARHAPCRPLRRADLARIRARRLRDRQAVARRRPPRACPRTRRACRPRRRSMCTAFSCR